MFVIVADIRKEALLIIQLAACTLTQQHTPQNVSDSVCCAYTTSFTDCNRIIIGIIVCIIMYVQTSKPANNIICPEFAQQRGHSNPFRFRGCCNE